MNKRNEKFFGLRRSVAIALLLAFFIQLSSPTIAFANPKETVVITDTDVNVRTKPSTNGDSKVLGRVNTSDSFTLVGTEKDASGRAWFEISYKGNTAYVVSTYSKVVAETDSSSNAQESSETITVTDYSVNVRTGAGTSSNIIGKANTGDVYPLLETVRNAGDDWYKISYKGQTGYIIGTYSRITSKTQVEEPAVTEALPVAREERSENANHAYSVSPYNQTIEQAAAAQAASRRPVTSSSNGWTPASVNQVKAAMDPLRILQVDYRQEVEAPDTVKITTDNLRVRSTASLSGTVLAKVHSGQVYDVLDQSGNWLQIRVGNQTGWVSGEFTAPVGESAASYAIGEVISVKTASLNIRERASLDAKVVGSAKRGEAFFIVDESNDWVKIVKNGVSGWILSVHAGEVLAEKTESVPQQMYQFLDLREYTGLSASSINEKLLQNKGVLSNQGDAFVEASQKYSVNEVYLVSHALLETGQGKSTLAANAWYHPTRKTATSTSASVSAQKLKADGYVQVYNVYGISAIDSSPFQSGARFAYEAGWTTPEKAIVEGAQWIASRYINNDKYNQYTLYRMRWNPEYSSHQYATDINWATKQTNLMKKTYDTVSNYNFKFVIPQYK